MLKLVVREKKASFNAQFLAARARKQAAMDKVAEVNARLKEILKDLGLTEPLTSYTVQDREVGSADVDSLLVLPAESVGSGSVCSDFQHFRQSSGLRSR